MFSAALHRQHRGLDDRGNRAPAVVGVWINANTRGLFAHRVLGQRNVHASWIHGSLLCSLDTLFVFDLERSLARSGARVCRGSVRGSDARRRARVTMETLWFILAGFMITGYVVLDGFDLGAGAISA